PRMKPRAEDVFQLSGWPPDAINVYLIGDVLIDAGSRHAAGRILRQVRGREVSALALTHAHPDHQGAAHAVCSALGLPLWCGEGDAGAVEDPSLIPKRQPDHLANRLSYRLFAGPGHPVARRLREGDEV